MASAQGVSPATVQRIWSAGGLKPHLIKTFKLSNYKGFEEKLVDVVGLYMNPPERAAVFCFDEKTQCQAVARHRRQHMRSSTAHPKPSRSTRRPADER